MTDTPLAYLISCTATFLAGASVMLVGRATEPKAKLVFWAPREQLFQIPRIKPLSSEPNQDKSINTEEDFRIVSREVATVNLPDKFQVGITSCFIQNIGKKKAENIEICHVSRPEHFKLFPSLDYEESNTPDGAHIIRIKNLGPQNVVALECFSLVALPKLNYIRTGDEYGEQISFCYQRILPKWQIWTYAFFALVGVGVILTILLWAGLSGFGIMKLPHWSF